MPPGCFHRSLGKCSCRPRSRPKSLLGTSKQCAACSNQQANSAQGLLTALSELRGSSGGKCYRTGKGDIRVMAPDTCESGLGDQGQHSSYPQGVRKHLERTVRRQLRLAWTACTSQARPVARRHKGATSARGDDLRSVALRLGHWELAVDSVEMAAPQGNLLPKRVSCLLC